MTLLAVCSTEIDWTATGAWFSGFATLAGVIVACYAMSTWRKQIHLQDRYQKADALLSSFILCIRAGSDWQLGCGVGENRATTGDSEKAHLWNLWINALRDYRLTWELAHSLFVGDQCSKSLTAHPEKLQSEIIGAGNHLLNPPDGTLLFLKQLEKIGAVGVSEIIARRNAK